MKGKRVVTFTIELTYQELLDLRVDLHGFTGGPASRLARLLEDLLEDDAE